MTGRSAPPLMKERNKKKKKKVVYIDDGHTVYSMEGLDPDVAKRKNAETNLTRKERHALIRAGMARYLPILFLVLACFAVAAVLLYFWLMY